MHLMKKQEIWFSEQNNYSNCPLTHCFTPYTMFEKKIMSFWKIIKLNNTYSLYRPTVLISYVTVMFYKTTSFKTLFSYCRKFDHLLWNPVHHQCKLHGENFYITLVNVHTYNKKHDFILWIFGENSRGGGGFPPSPHSTLPEICKLYCRCGGDL